MQRNALIRVLGPIDVLTQSGPVSVGGHHSRVLLGTLAVAAGRTVSIDQLRAALWGSSQPSSAESSLHTYAWRLRRQLGSEVLVTVDHSYLLDVHRDQIDALCFEDLLVEAIDAQSDPQRCVKLCRDGLSMWRGPPFGELADNEVFRLEAMRLEELRLTVTERLLTAEVALGHLDIAVAELECAVQENPYREHLWYLLIDSLQREGRRVEALRACRGLRGALAEVGVEPTGDLAAIESEIIG